MSILIEHTAGKFPLWLTPEQFVLINVGEKFNPYSESVQKQLAAHDIRGVIDNRGESIGKKIRDNELKKIPFLLIIGEKEMESNTISVRRQGEGDVGTMTIDEFVAHFQKEAEA